jgi:hypothetical protein
MPRPRCRLVRIKLIIVRFGVRHKLNHRPDQYAATELAYKLYDSEKDGLIYSQLSPPILIPYDVQSPATSLGSSQSLITSSLAINCISSPASICQLIWQ